MKRFLAFILAIIMAFSFTGCGKPNIEDCVKSADSVVPKTTPLAGNDYKFSTQYILKKIPMRYLCILTKML